MAPVSNFTCVITYTSEADILVKFQDILAKAIIIHILNW
jgi:hypothetical protein